MQNFLKSAAPHHLIFQGGTVLQKYCFYQQQNGNQFRNLLRLQFRFLPLREDNMNERNKHRSFREYFYEKSRVKPCLFMKKLPELDSNQQPNG